MFTVIHPQTGLGRVSLTIRDMTRSLDYYCERLGLKLHRREDRRAYLGTGGPDLLVLEENPAATSPKRHTGLYHFALLLPTRRDLAALFRHLAEQQIPIQGMANHFVSEAVYLGDPDGNGIEIYSDRPRSEWVWKNGEMNIGTEPLDVGNVLAELGEHPPAWNGLPTGTVLGHMHLHMANLPAAERFYHDIVGFDFIARFGRVMSFLAAGGYHHHLACRVGAGPTESDAIGLNWFEILLPDRPALEAVLNRLRAADIDVTEDAEGYFLRDFSNTGIRLNAVL